MLRPTPRRFRPEALFRPRSIAVIGPGTETGRPFVRNIEGAQYGGTLLTVETAEQLTAPPDLAVIAVADAQNQLETLARLGACATIVATTAAIRPTGCRVLGPGAFGVIVPSLHLNASAGHLPARPGKLALVSPSAALCRTVLDWAEPNGVGFSHVVGTGLETDVDAAVILDFLSREPSTGAILLDIRTVRDRRAFMSAARAAAQLRPVVAIHAGARQRDPSGRSDEVISAALRRAGILRVTTLAELLAAAEILTRARPPRSDSLVIVSNAIGAGQLAADHALRMGLPLAAPDLAARTVLQMQLPELPSEPGLIWTGDDQPTRPAEAVAMLSALPEVGGMVAILAPTGEADAAGAAALAAAQPTLKAPLLACVLGETTAAVRRRTLAEAGVPVFASPEQAVRGFAQLVMQRRARAAARELPSSRVLQLAPDVGRVRQVIATARAQGRDALLQDEALDVLSAYGIPVAHGLMVQRQIGPARGLRITVADDALFGPAIGFGPGGRDRLEDASFELPPLNLALAHGLLARSNAAMLLANGHEAADRNAVADVLVRVSQLVIDVPEVASLVIDPLFADTTGVSAAEAWLRLRPPGEDGLTAIAPYPAELVGHWTAGGETLEIRPIRPEDAEAHSAFFKRLTPEDVRYRFFSLLRDLSAEQLARMTQIDYDREMAIVAVRGSETVGVARLVREPGGSAEFAIAVDPALKGKGLGRNLMERIIQWARRQGVSTIAGQILSDNAPMLAFIRRLGFEIRRVPQASDVVEARLDVQ